MCAWVKRGWIDRKKMRNAALSVWLRRWHIVIDVALVAVFCRINRIYHAGEVGRAKRTVNWDVVWR